MGKVAVKARVEAEQKRRKAAVAPRSKVEDQVASALAVAPKTRVEDQATVNSTKLKPPANLLAVVVALVVKAEVVEAEVVAVEVVAVEMV